MGMGEKKTKENAKKISPFGYSLIPLFYDMEADCFPVSENTKNKPDIP